MVDILHILILSLTARIRLFHKQNLFIDVVHNAMYAVYTVCSALQVSSLHCFSVILNALIPRLDITSRLEIFKYYFVSVVELYVTGYFAAVYL